MTLGDGCTCGPYMSIIPPRPCPWHSNRPATYGTSTTWLQTTVAPTWHAAMRAVACLNLSLVDGKVTVRKQPFGDKWLVSWQPRMYLINSAAS